MQPQLPYQWNPLALLALPAGIAALINVTGGFTLVFAGVPGAAMLAAALALFALPGDPRLTAYLALSAAGGMLGSVFVLFADGFGAGFVQGLLSFAAFLVAGRAGVRSQAVIDDMPVRDMRWPMDLKVALDEMMIGYFVASARIAGGEAARREAEDAAATAMLLDERGWRSDPRGFHRDPPPPVDVRAVTQRIYGFDYEQLRFDSGFEPDPALPGAASWSTHLENRAANAWVLRHPGPMRPWLVCLHGYRMGSAWLDFTMFRPSELHRALGVNLLIPTLPLHGPRKTGWRSGDRYLDGDLRELLCAEAQTLWDLRRWLRWLREQEGATSIGVYGVSLGGRAAAQLSCHDGDLDFVVAGMPLTDVAFNLWRFMPLPHRAYFAHQGLDERALRALLHVVSPLALPTRLARERLSIIGPTCDRVIPPQQSLALAAHWGCPVDWYQGSHLSYRHEDLPKQVLGRAMRDAGWAVGG